jgi:D-tyrosyl-tRNA(Tyr) deacylase
VTQASVTVEGAITGQIGHGLLILICAMQGDGPEQADRLASKIVKLRVFKDEAGKMNRSLIDIQGSALIVSQFTLAADLRGNRPGFSTAAPPDLGRTLYAHFTASIAATGIATQTGIFGADMDVALHNDGPVTIWIDTDKM